MSDIIDLDVFIAEPRIIKFGGEEITVNQPKTVDLIQLGYYTNKLMKVQDGDSKGIDDAELQVIIDKMTERIYSCVPQLTGKTLTKAQLQALVNILSDMAMPEEAKHLAAAGIERDTPKKVQ